VLLALVARGDARLLDAFVGKEADVELVARLRGEASAALRRAVVRVNPARD
jgi:hypothetical protein